MYRPLYFSKKIIKAQGCKKSGTNYGNRDISLGGGAVLVLVCRSQIYPPDH